jgi:hypothetical protein
LVEVHLIPQNKPSGGLSNSLYSSLPSQLFWQYGSDGKRNVVADFLDVKEKTTTTVTKCSCPYWDLIGFLVFWGRGLPRILVAYWMAGFFVLACF